MILFFLLVVVILTIVVLLSLFVPHKLPWYRPHLVLSSSEVTMIQPQTVSRQPMVMEGLVEPDKIDLDVSSQEKIDRLENILIEKTALVEKLQKQVLAEKSHRTEFEKVQTLLEGEVTKLRKLNQELRVKIGEENA